MSSENKKNSPDNKEIEGIEYEEFENSHRMTSLEKSLKNLIYGIPESLWDKELLSELNGRFDKSLESEPEFVHENSIKLEDRLFFLFYRLAKLENFKQINNSNALSKAKLKAAKRRQREESNEIKSKKIKTRGKQNPFKDAQNYADELLKLEEWNQSLQGPELPVGLHSLKLIVEDYRDSWKLFIGLDSDSKDSLIKDIRDRVESLIVPTYEKAFYTRDLLRFTSEMFDYSLEMGVCAYVAYKHDEKDLAWVSYAKASELMGLCVGTRTLLNRSANYRRSRKATVDREEGKDFLEACLIKKLNEKLEELDSVPEELQMEILGIDDRDSIAIKDDFIEDLTEYAFSIRESLGKGFIKPTKKDKELNDGEIKLGEEFFTKFKLKSWLEIALEKEGDLRKAFDSYLNRYLLLSGSDPVSWGEQESETVQVSLRHLKDIYNLVNENNEIMEDFLTYPECESSECPVRKRYKAHNKKAEQMLKDPLFGKV